VVLVVWVGLVAVLVLLLVVEQKQPLAATRYILSLVAVLWLFLPFLMALPLNIWLLLAVVRAANGRTHYPRPLVLVRAV